MIIDKYIVNQIGKHIKEKGYTPIITAHDKNIVSQRGIERAGYELVAVGTYIRILMLFTFWSSKKVEI